jgi:hypothetical protein
MMRDDIHPDDPKAIWQKQPTEASTMTLETIRETARKLHAKTRRELFGSIAVVLIVFALSGFGILRTRDPGLRVIFMLAIAWALAGQYFLHRGMWSPILPGDAASSTGLEFYRREVKRQCNLFGRVLQWGLGPVVLSIGAFILALIGMAKNSGVPVQRILPFCTLVSVWIVVVFILRSRARRALQREIAELNDLEEESSRPRAS